jgi:hypothetical protein
MIANESFLASASLRDNVVSNARQIGYLPTSARSAFSDINFTFTLDPDDYTQGLPEYLEIRPGMAFTTNGGDGNLGLQHHRHSKCTGSIRRNCHFYNVHHL